ncbi:unnamed protein product [Absidia cylindrospora]
MQVLVIRRCLHNSARLLRSTTRGQFKLPADPTTTTYRGMLFEWQTQKAFESIGMQLRHIGGRSDGGINLKGQWTFSLNASDNNNGHGLSASIQNDDFVRGDDEGLIPVVVQCKNVKTGCTPDHLRGLLGATTFTPDTMALFGASTLPLGLARVTPDAVLDALVLNHTAQQWLDIQILPRFDALGNPVFPPLIMTGNGRVVRSSEEEEEEEEEALLQHQLS